MADASPTAPRWERYPRVAENTLAREWLTVQADLQLAANTIDAYGRAVGEYLGFAADGSFAPLVATRADIGRFVRHLTSRAARRGGGQLANATIQQRLTAVRLFYAYLVEEQLLSRNPVSRGTHLHAGQPFQNGDRALVPKKVKLPWIPSDDQWTTIVEAAGGESLRDRLLFALAYDAALRREELVSLEIRDFSPADRQITIRAEASKGRRSRIVHYSETSSTLYQQYLPVRRRLDRSAGPLFRSESRRNYGQPISIYTWHEVVERIAARVDLAHQLTTHTFRHLCLTHLARAGWELQDIATFAGHRHIQTTLIYIHLSGRDLGPKYAHAMAEIGRWSGVRGENEQGTQ